MDHALASIDWFIPSELRYERSELGLARNFVFTHLFGPLISQSILIFLYWSDPQGGWPMWTICFSVWGFWLLPFLFKYTANLFISALVSVELLSFAALFGAFFYGGSSSPFLPWFIVSLLLGFFYLSKRPIFVVGIFALNLTIFFSAYWVYGFSERVPRDELAPVGWISILSATIYMAWMAVYYAGMLSRRTELVRESEQHRTTMQRLREAKQTADEANHARSIFLAKMSHELRTPLNAVIGYSEIVIENLGQSAHDKRKTDDLMRINAAGKHLLSLVTDVLDLSRIENDEIDIKIQKVDLNEFMRDIFSSTEGLVSGNHNKYVLDCPQKLGDIITDATKLRQAVVNLIGNAAKFTKDGAVTVSARRERSSVGDWIEIRVADTGIGIPTDVLPKLFANFRQASSSTASRYGGTGLGLAHSQKLCGLLGGRISVTSESGKGSTFTIRVLARLDAIERQSNGRLANTGAAFAMLPA